MTALLAVDVGNTNTVLGVYRDDVLVAHWRIQTVAERTADEYAVTLKTLHRPPTIHGPSRSVRGLSTAPMASPPMLRLA